MTVLLPNFPVENQLAEPLASGDADGRRWDCVPACLAAMVRYFQPARPVDGVTLKDAVYGPGYVGPQTAARYAPYLAQQRQLRLAAVNGTRAALQSSLQAALIAGQPVLFTGSSNGQPVLDPLNYTEPTHVQVAYGYDDAGLWHMNPWGGLQEYTAWSWFLTTTVFDQIWTMHTEEDPMLTLPTTIHDDGTTLHYDGATAIVEGEFAAYLRANPLYAHTFGAPRGNAVASHNIRVNTTTLPGTLQIFEYGALITDPSLPAGRDVYPLQIGDVLISVLDQQVPAAALAQVGWSGSAE